jgi:hypothetical protein
MSENPFLLGRKIQPVTVMKEGSSGISGKAQTGY